MNDSQQQAQVLMKRIGAVFDPPTLLVEYEKFINGEQQRCHRQLRLRHLCPENADDMAISKLLVENHPQDFSNVEFEQVHRIVGRIVEGFRSDLEGVKNVEKRTTAVDKPKISASLKDQLKNLRNLNHVDVGQLNQAKREMDVAFNSALVKPGDDGYEFDKQVDFGEAVDDCSWD